MSREEAIELVRQLEEAVNSHDTARLLGFYADEAVTVSPMFAGTAGRADIAKGWDTIFSLFLAGHNPPIILTRKGIRRLTAGGPILGAFSESEFGEETVALRGGDTIIMFSDGVTEARDAHDREFGEERLISCVTASATKPAPDVLRRILECVQEFCRGTAQTDDITVAATRYHKP